MKEAFGNNNKKYENKDCRSNQDDNLRQQVVSKFF
jgi:hypothetical protein